MMTRSKTVTFLPEKLNQIVSLFWTRAGSTESYPRDLSEAIHVALPIFIQNIPGLSTESIKEWAQRREIKNLEIKGARRLFGCLIIYREHGILFVDSSAPPAEQRFTRAHEVGHYFHDYLLPRQRSLDKLGSEIVEVLNGERTLTQAERIDAILSSAPIKPYIHLMDRDSEGQTAHSQTVYAESTADRIALELLAPYRDVLEATTQLFNSRPLRSQLQTALPPLLIETFGLPSHIAAVYAKALAYHSGRPPSVCEFFEL
jgi:hypothetical protein